MDVRLRIRAARTADAPVMGAIERRCFSDPWSAASFVETLASPWTVALVAEVDDAIVGYMVGRETAGSGEVLNLAVAPDARRHGIGRALLDAGLQALRARRVDEVFLEVRASNRSAQALYQSVGFQAVGQRAGYYRSPREDAVVLRLNLGATA